MKKLFSITLLSIIVACGAQREPEAPKFDAEKSAAHLKTLGELNTKLKEVGITAGIDDENNQVSFYSNVDKQGKQLKLDQYVIDDRLEALDIYVEGLQKLLKATEAAEGETPEFDPEMADKIKKLVELAEKMIAQLNGDEEEDAEEEEK